MYTIMHYTVLHNVYEVNDNYAMIKVGQDVEIKGTISLCYNIKMIFMLDSS